jgi:transcriptional regulator with XRE-family HTH domain
VNAKRIARARRERGLSMHELARRAGVSAATIHNLETGKFNPTGATLRKVLQALQAVPKLPTVE